MEKVRLLYLFGDYDGLMYEEEMSNPESQVRHVRMIKKIKAPSIDDYLNGERSNTTSIKVVYDDYFPHKFIADQYYIYLMIESGYTIDDALKRLTENYFPTLCENKPNKNVVAPDLEYVRESYDSTKE